jgi:hypothetical protein
MPSLNHLSVEEFGVVLPFFEPLDPISLPPKNFFPILTFLWLGRDILVLLSKIFQSTMKNDLLLDMFHICFYMLLVFKDVSKTLFVPIFELLGF